MPKFRVVQVFEKDKFKYYPQIKLWWCPFWIIFCYQRTVSRPLPTSYSCDQEAWDMIDTYRLDQSQPKKRRPKKIIQYSRPPKEPVEK